MPRPTTSRSPVFFSTPEAFRRWLARNGSTASELFVGFYKVGSGKPSLTWSESVDEALCFGWIDGVRRRIDDESYQIRFTPRRRVSIWSAINIAKVEVLITQGRMQPAGLEAYSHREERRSRVYSYEQDALAELSPDELARFRVNRPAWEFFDGATPSYRRGIVQWVVSPKLPSTRARRLSRLIDSCATRRRLMP